MAKFLLCFSLIQNTNRILSTNIPPGAITSINGMRVLSMWWVILGHCYAFQTTAGLPSKLFQIFITDKLPKIYFRRRNNYSRQQLFQYFKGEKDLLCNPGSEECQCRYERGVVFLSLGGQAATFPALGWCSSLLSSLDIASLVAHQRHSEPITLMEFCHWFTQLCSKSFSHCSPWTVSRKYIW